MSEDKGSVVYVDAHTRDGYDVSAYTRSWPGSSGKLSSRVDAVSDFKGEKESKNVKEALHRLGYDKEDNTITAIIKQFQKDNGLTIDGYMEPDGESIKKLNEVMMQSRSRVFANKPDISNMTTKEMLKGMFEGTLPVTKTDPETGFKSQVYEGQDHEDVIQGTPYINRDTIAFAQVLGGADEQVEDRFYRFSERMEPREGGYEVRATHIDQPTNLGITQATLDRFRQNNPNEARYFPIDIRNLTRGQANDIYRNDYYEANRIGDIEDDAVAETMYDFYVNHSPRLPGRILQEAINHNSPENIVIDGDPRQLTINALNRATQNPETRRNIINYIFDERVSAATRETRSDLVGGVVNRIETLRRQLLDELNYE